MITKIVMSCLLVTLLAAKKKPVFGQLTLTGEMALDWLKPGSEIHAGKIMFGPLGAFPEYNVPDWAIERNKEIVIIVHQNTVMNPLLVTQRSVMKALEAHCVEWESQGALCQVEKVASTTRATIEFDEGGPHLKFDRDPKAGKFAPYTVTIQE